MSGAARSADAGEGARGRLSRAWDRLQGKENFFAECKYRVKAVAVTTPNDKRAQISHLLPSGAGYSRAVTDSRMSLLKCSQTFEVVEHLPPERFSLSKTCDM